MSLLEHWIILDILSRGEIPEGYKYFQGEGFLPQYITGVILLVFLGLGLVFGLHWWKIVYVEKIKRTWF